MRPWILLVLALLPSAAPAQVEDLVPSIGRPKPNQTGDADEEVWRETEAELPAFPRKENLVEFYVSAVTPNVYAIDPGTLSVGPDGVVRYVLVVQTAGGATNVSFEGIHCKERRWKHYAAGRVDSATWTRARAAQSEWRLIENKPINRHHAALNREFFCPLGHPIASADEGREALRLGKHLNAN